MRFDYVFIAFGIFAGAALALLSPQAPQVFKVIPPLMALLGAILLFDVGAAYVRGVPVMTSTSTQTRVFAFLAGALALILSGGG
jgi:peptidoglycan/LPS O-acetylase OafA/YrhL